MTFLSADIPISRAYVTTPGVPPERVQALRRAFDATMKDPQFIAEAAKLSMDISPSTGEEAQKYSDLIANTPAPCWRGRRRSSRASSLSPPRRRSGVRGDRRAVLARVATHDNRLRPVASASAE